MQCEWERSRTKFWIVHLNEGTILDTWGEMGTILESILSKQNDKGME